MNFLEADKVVFAFPLWNFTVPAPLITYISYLSQAGKRLNIQLMAQEGLAGGKKVVVLGARGSDHSFQNGSCKAPMEMAKLIT
ncbi:NAD(P)H-dependent oxidoreductase [Bacillus pacificus]